MCIMWRENKHAQDYMPYRTQRQVTKLQNCIRKKSDYSCKWKKEKKQNYRRCSNRTDSWIKTNDSIRSLFCLIWRETDRCTSTIHGNSFLSEAESTGICRHVSADKNSIQQKAFWIRISKRINNCSSNKTNLKAEKVVSHSPCKEVFNFHEHSIWCWTIVNFWLSDLIGWLIFIWCAQIKTVCKNISGSKIDTHASSQRWRWEVGRRRV